MDGSCRFSWVRRSAATASPRLLKALRHELPGVAHTRKRLGIEDKGPALAQVMRTVHTAHGGKLSLARVLRGAFADGATVVNSRGVEERIGGLARLMGAMSSKLTRAEEGDTVAFARLEDLATGDRIADGRTAPSLGATAGAPPPTQGIAIRVKDRKDEVRLASALAKLCEEDRALSYVQDAEMSELKLLGQGEMHLRVTAERLADRFGVTIQVAQAVGRLSGINSRRGHGARTAQKTVRRPWPVRRRCRRGRAHAVAARASPSPSGCMADRCRGSIFLPLKLARATRWRAVR